MNRASTHHTNTNYIYAAFVCGLAALFYLYEFILQISPGVMTHALMLDLQCDAAVLSAIVASYYFSYTPMMIVSGVLFDRYDARTLMSIAVLVCVFGTLLFCLTNHYSLLAFGRFLMGFGSSFAFVGVLVLISRWFPPQYFAFLVGITELMGSLGAVIGEAPVSMANMIYGWRDTMLFLAGMGLLLALAVWIFVRNRPNTDIASDTAESVAESELQKLLLVCRQRQTWVIAFYSFMVWAPVTVFAALWGVPFLMAKFNTDATTASGAVTMVWLGVGLGSPFLGWWSDRIKRRCLPLSAAALTGVIAMTWIIYIPEQPFSLIYLLTFLFGTAAAGQSLAFALVKDVNPTRTIGTAIGINNMAVVAGGMLFQPLAGLLLRFTSDGRIEAGIPVYTLSNYEWALAILPLCYILALVVSLFFLKETHCKSVYTNSDNET